MKHSKSLPSILPQEQGRTVYETVHERENFKRNIANQGQQPQVCPQKRQSLCKNQPYKQHPQIRQLPKSSPPKALFSKEGVTAKPVTGDSQKCECPLGHRRRTARFLFVRFPLTTLWKHHVLFPEAILTRLRWELLSKGAFWWGPATYRPSRQNRNKPSYTKANCAKQSRGKPQLPLSPPTS